MVRIIPDKVLPRLDIKEQKKKKQINYQHSKISDGRIQFRKSTNTVKSTSLPVQMRKMASIHLIHFYTYFLIMGDG